jgi:hypothetical protein
MALTLATRMRKMSTPGPTVSSDESVAERIEKLTHNLDISQQSRKYWMELCGDRDSRVATLEAEVETLRLELGNLNGERVDVQIEASDSSSPCAGLLELPPTLPRQGHDPRRSTRPARQSAHDWLDHLGSR